MLSRRSFLISAAAAAVSACGTSSPQRTSTTSTAVPSAGRFPRAVAHELGRTVVMVLHDLNHAARYADHIIAMRDGAIVAAGAPAQVLTERLVEHVFGLACRIVTCPVSGAPLVVPVGGPRR